MKRCDNSGKGAKYPEKAVLESLFWKNPGRGLFILQSPRMGSFPFLKIKPLLNFSSFLKSVFLKSARFLKSVSCLIMFPGFFNGHCPHPELSGRKDLVFVRVSEGHNAPGFEFESHSFECGHKKPEVRFFVPHVG